MWYKFTYVECGFSSIGSWSYSREWVSGLRTKLLYCIASVSAVSPGLHSQEFDISYIMFYVIQKVAVVWWLTLKDSNSAVCVHFPGG